MKKIPIPLAFIAGILFTAIISWGNKTPGHHFGFNRQSPDSRPVLAMRKIKLKEGVSAEIFEKFAIKVANDEIGKLPGIKFYYGKGERGDEPGSYVLFMEFDSKTTRNFYAPAEDDNSKRNAEATKLVDGFFGKYTPEFDKLAEVITPAGKKGYVDYIILK
jgi:hypothetical protein